MMTNLYEIPVEKQEHEIVKRGNNPYLNRAIHALWHEGIRKWEIVNKMKIEELLKIKDLSMNGIKLLMKEMDDLGI